MPDITPAEARAYLDRWQQLAVVEEAELRRTSMQTKLQQLAALIDCRAVFGLEPERDEQIREVRERWACLRRVESG